MGPKKGGKKKKDDGGDAGGGAETADQVLEYFKFPPPLP